MKKPTDEQDMDIQDEIVDAGTTGDLRGVIDLLRAGKVNQDLLNVAAALLEQVAADPKHQRAVARKQRDVQMRMDIENEYRNRLQGPLACFGVTISEDEQEGQDVLADRLAAKYGFTDRRRIEQIAAELGVTGLGRKARNKPRI